MVERNLNIEEIYVGDVIKVEDFLYSRMEKNNYRPFVVGDVLEGKKHNLFVKEGQHYISIVTGARYKVMSYPCRLGDVGIDELSIEPLSSKLSDIEVPNINLNRQDVKYMQNLFERVFSGLNWEYAEKFEEFLDYYEGKEME